MDMDQIPDYMLQNSVRALNKDKYDWSLAHPCTKLITTDADGHVREWFGRITSELSVVAYCDWRWVKNPHNSIEQNKNIAVSWPCRVPPFKGNWLTSAEMRPEPKKPAYNQMDFLNFFRHLALYSQVARREFDLGVSPDSAYVSPFVTPESVVSDEKAGQS